MNASYDVAIVGAGPAGSAAAAALAQRGWDVLLLEQGELPRHKVCGEFLSPEAQSTLHALHLDEWVASHAPVALHHVQLHAPGAQQLRVALPGVAWGLSRYTLDAALAAAAHAHDVTICTGVTVTAVTAAEGTQSSGTESAYLLHLRPKGSVVDEHRTRRGDTQLTPGVDLQLPATVTTRALLLACGRHHRLAAPPSPAAGVRFVGVKCHYAGCTLAPAVSLFFFPGGYGGMNPVESGRANLCLFVTYDAFQRAGGTPAAMVAAATDMAPMLAACIAGADRVPQTLKTVAAVDTAQPATPWQRWDGQSTAYPGVASLGAPCIGDAAAMITPLCGDGMAMALRSAELCVPLADAFLCGQSTRDEWARVYAQAWHGEFDRRLLLGRLLQTILVRPRLATTLIRLGRWTPALASYLVGATRGSLSDSSRTG